MLPSMGGDVGDGLMEAGPAGQELVDFADGLAPGEAEYVAPAEAVEPLDEVAIANDLFDQQMQELFAPEPDWNPLPDASGGGMGDLETRLMDDPASPPPGPFDMPDVMG